MFRYFRSCLLVMAAILCTTAVSFAQTGEEKDILQMIYRENELVVTAMRSARPITQIAENVTVVTAEEIAAINAHTLTDVLYHVTGVQVDMRGGPGTSTTAMIQGSDSRHVQVMVDGVSFNSLADNFADISAIPVQQIERIEIVKGPASSAWGSSLGGIINIITKSPDPERSLGGTASAAIGERTTGDFRTDLSGTVGKFGYYLYGGGITSDGLTPHMATDTGNLYTKLQWSFTDRTRVQLSFGYEKGSRGDGAAPPFDIASRNNFERFFSTATLHHEINEALELDISGRVAKRRISQFLDQMSSGLQVNGITNDDLNSGGSAKLAWHRGVQSLLMGADFDNGRLESAAIKDGKQRQVKWALFANDTLTLGDFSIIPGVRYDHTSTNDDFVSPSLGITYTPFAQTILRAYVARGFNAPPLFSTFGDGFFSLPNPGLQMEKVWSYSAGIETALFDCLWFKATGFLHDISDVITFEQLSPLSVIPVNKGKQRRQGFEAELKTVPLYNTSALVGFAFNDVKDRQTDRRIPDSPRQTWDLGLDYDDDTLRGALRGHFTWWNAAASQNGKYKAFIWDLNLGRKMIVRGDTTVELFFTAHNLFNGSQYLNGFFPNPRRWFEGGVKCTF